MRIALCANDTKNVDAGGHQRTTVAEDGSRQALLARVYNSLFFDPWLADTKQR